MVEKKWEDQAEAQAKAYAVSLKSATHYTDFTDLDLKNSSLFCVMGAHSQIWCQPHLGNSQMSTLNVTHWERSLKRSKWQHQSNLTSILEKKESKHYAHRETMWGHRNTICNLRTEPRGTSLPMPALCTAASLLQGLQFTAPCQTANNYLQL